MLQGQTSPHLCFTSVTETQIQASFAPRPGVFVLTAILRQALAPPFWSAANDPK